MILSESFYCRPTLEVLEDLMGMILVRNSKEGLTSGVIVEAEAYRGEDDPASFASQGKTKRSDVTISRLKDFFYIYFLLR